jgi:hypothetical protein
MDTQSADPRTGLAKERTGFAKFRTQLALDRTTLASLRAGNPTPEAIQLHQGAITFGVTLVVTLGLC